MLKAGFIARPFLLSWEKTMRAAAVCLAGLGLMLNSAWAQEVDMLSGIWTGTYTCAQGLTAMTLSIDSDGESWQGVFDFGPLKGNKTVPHGAYQVTVEQHADGYTFAPGEWIERPEGYYPVTLHGQLSPDQMQLSGSVEFDGCSTFETQRLGPLPVTDAGKTKP
jgi:hypothetical protein